MGLYTNGPGRGPDTARRLVKKFSGPVATVYSCPFCNFVLKFPKSRPGAGVGRGYGLRMGGALHSQCAAHIRAEHPEKLLRTYLADLGCH